MLQIKMNLKYPFIKYVAFRCDLDPADMEKRKRKSPPEKNEPAGYFEFASKKNFFKICYKKMFFLYFELTRNINMAAPFKFTKVLGKNMKI